MTRLSADLAITAKACKLDSDATAMAGTSQRGAAILAHVAGALRTAADIYGLDPTLDGCPAGRERDLDLVMELARQIPVVVRQAVRGGPDERWPIEDRWAEAEVLADRLPAILDRALAAARPDYAEPDVSREISRMWLIAAAPHVFALAEQIAEAVVKAGSLPHVCPEVGRIGELAQELMNLATALEAMQPKEGP